MSLQLSKTCLGNFYPSYITLSQPNYLLGITVQVVDSLIFSHYLFNAPFDLDSIMIFDHYHVFPPGLASRAAVHQSHVATEHLESGQSKWRCTVSRKKKYKAYFEDLEPLKECDISVAICVYWLHFKMATFQIY